jgi:hypothetical protein
MKHIHTPGEYRAEMDARGLHLAIEEMNSLHRCVVMNGKQEIVACSSWYGLDTPQDSLIYLACEDALG